MPECKTCQKPLGRKNRTGYCNQHAKQSPEYRAKLAAAQRRAQAADPTIRERKSAKMRELAATPEWKARNRELCTERRLWEHGLAARRPDTPAKWGRTFSRRHGILRWCPEEYLDLARKLARSNVPPAEVKRMVLEQQERDLAELRRRMSGSKPVAFIEH